MSPVQPPRQLLVWSLPTVAVLLGVLWYKRRRGASSAAAAAAPKPSTAPLPADPQPSEAVAAAAATAAETRPSCSRSLSGVDSAPIDIKCSRSAPIHMTDTELDLEIERMKLTKAHTPAGVAVAAPRPLPRTPDRDSANHSPCGEAIAPPASPSLSSAGGASAEHSDSDSGKGGSDVATPPPRPKQQLQPPSPAQQPPTPTPTPPPSPSPPKEQPLEQPKQQKQPQKSPIKQKQKLSKKQKRQQKFHPIESIEKLEQNGDVNVTAADSTVCEEKQPEPDECIVYEFVISQSLVGRLIGKHGAFVHEIHERTGVSVLVKRHPLEGPHTKVCALEGGASAVREALTMIRARFPHKRYPELTLERISFAPVVPDFMYLRLIEGINNDTLVSYIASPAHLFVQQPTHPTYPALATLSACMDAAYAGEAHVPPVPWPAAVGTVCAAADADGHWHRVSVVSVAEQTASVQLLDYGGCLDVEEKALRQIRADFVTLPFQATQCYLADIGPPGEDSAWPQEAYEAVAQLTTGAAVYTQVLDYAEDGVPLVRVYVPVPGRRTTLLLNNELVDRGLAQRLLPIQ